MRILALTLLFASLVFGQLDSNSVLVTATRQIYPVADEVVFSLTVTSGMQTGLDDVTAALSAAGVSAAQFSGVYTNYGGADGDTLGWSFTLSAPFSNLKDSLALLSAAKKAIGSNRSGLTMFFSMQGPQPSAKQQAAAQCSQSDLIADARRQAQNLTDAAGLGLGPLLSVSDAAAPVWTGATTFAVLGIYFAPTVTPVTCTATVKFGITRY